MSYSCTICFEPLVSSSNPISALVCGHTFHKTCINRWISLNTPPQCPLCKKIIHKSKIISPLFFSDNNGESAVAESPETTEKITKLEENNKKLRIKIGSLNREVHNSKEEVKRLKDELTRVRDQKSYVKMIKRVVDLDNDINSKEMQEYIEKVKTFEPQNLFLHVGALRARQIRAEKENFKVIHINERKDKEIEVLKETIAQLHNHIRNTPSKTTLQERADNFRSKIERRQVNVVILDSDIEDEEGDDNDDTFSVGQARDEDRPNGIRPDEIPENNNALLYPEDISEGDEEESFVVVEHVPPLSRRPFKRVSAYIDDEPTSSSRPKKVIKIDLTDDDDNTI